MTHQSFTTLFHGPAGTGKTVTAERLGRYLQQNVVHYKLTKLKGKTINETEANLGAVFGKAENKGWILFFDEADALFGKRSEVDDSHDRYANQEVSYLLQSIEKYKGVVILSSNRRSPADAKVKLKCDAEIKFPKPDFDSEDFKKLSALVLPRERDSFISGLKHELKHLTDWTQFIRTIKVKAPLNKVYWAWATQKGIETWFLKSAVYTDDEGRKKDENEWVLPGDNYTWQWHNWDITEHGKVLDANGRDRFAFTFEIANVLVDLKEEGEYTMVRLHQKDMDTDDKSKMRYYVGCSNGWTFWLANLKAWLEHGILLNEKGSVYNPDGMSIVNM